MDNFFSESKENTFIYFLFHVLNKLILLPRNLRNRKNILYVERGTNSLL